MGSMKRIACLMLAIPGAWAQSQTPPRSAPSAQPSIADIMARVAANQEKSVEARKQFVYKQEQLFSLHRTNGKLACQTTREFAVAPGARGIEKKLVKQEEKGDGSCDADHTTVNIDGDLMAGVSEGGNKHSHEDDVPRDLFPLRAREQRYYDYRLADVETYHGRPVYRVAFQPRRTPKATDDDTDEDGVWKGEALIDAGEFQPVQVYTDLAVKVPMAVRILLGTNVRGVGFSVSYERVADGVWFPTGFGGEFKLNALFFYRRSITINVKNSDFKRADVQSNVAFDKIQ
jgi:hypothetical protein